MKMKLFFSCTLAAVLGLVRCLDLKCEFDDDDTNCKIAGPVTVKIGEKVNIVSDGNLNSINRIIFYKHEGNGSEISTVPGEIFEQLPNVVTLELHSTEEVLNKGDFEKAGQLRNLTIGDQLKTISAGVLNSVKGLEGLTFSENQIAEIEDNAFSGLNALLNINLGNNNLKIIKQNTFNGLEKLEYLNVYSNRIETIEENALNLPNLKELDMSNNKLTSLSDNLFVATPLLKHFDAQSNQINHIGSSLYGLKNLEFLSLSYNKLTNVDLLVLSQLPQLKKLFLREIGLTSDNISKIEIKEPSTSVLSTLSLEHNELTNSSEDWKKLALVFPQLKHLDVEFTKYSKIDVGDETLCQLFPQLTEMFLSSSELNCDYLGNFVESSRKDGIDVKQSWPFSDSNKWNCMRLNVTNN